MNRVRTWWVPTAGVAITLVWLGATLPLLRMPLLFRALALVLFAASTAVRIASGAGRNRTWSAGAFVLAVVAGMLPVDISTLDFPGGPHLVPFVVGLPTPEGFEQGRRGEVVLAGCLATGFDPEWVLVW